MSSAVFSGNSPCRARAAASAIGATSGRTVCGWPPMFTPKRIEICRTAVYRSSTRPAVAARTRRISVSARSCSPCRSSRPMTGATSTTGSTI